MSRAALSPLVLVVVAALGHAPRPARAQLPDLAELQGQMLPSVPVDVPSATTRRPGVQISSYDAVVNVPIVLGATSFLIPGLAYHVDSVAYDAFPADTARLGAFHALELPIMFVQLLPARWSLALRVAPGLAGDLATVDGGTLRLGGVAMVTHELESSLTIGAGGIVSYAFGELLPLPALYLAWSPSRAVLLETFLPAFVRFVWRPSAGFELGLRADAAGNAYQIRDARVAQRWPCQADGARPAEPGRCLDHIAYSVVTVGATAAVRLSDPVWLGAFVGHTAYRRFDAKSAAGHDVDDGGQDLDETWVVRMSLTVRLPTGD